MMMAVATDELANVICWRERVLAHAGYDMEHALFLAADTRVDLHKACELVSSGCPTDLAYRIMRGDE